MRDLRVTVLSVPLLRRIVLFAVGIALLLPLYEFLVVYPKLTSSLLQTVELEAGRVGRHLAGNLEAQQNGSGPLVISDGFLQDLHDVIDDFHILHFRIHDVGGRLLYSTVTGETDGTVSPPDHSHDRVRQGETVSRLVDQNSRHTTSPDGLLHVMAVDVPVYSHGKIIALFEIEYDITDQKHVIENLLLHSGINILLMGALLLGFLVLVLREALSHITATARAEYALRVNEEKFRGISVAAHEAILMIQADGLLSYCNPAAGRLFGVAPESIPGTPFVATWLPERFRTMFADLLSPHTVQTDSMRAGHVRECAIQRPDGSEIPVEFSISAMRQDETPQTLVIMRDISERKQSEERLMLSSKVMEYALDGVIVTDADGTIEMVNPAFTHVTGYTREEAVGQNPKLLSSGRQSRDFYTSMWRNLLDQGSWQGEIWNRRKDGAVYPEWLSISALHGHDHQINHFIAIFSDISRRKQSEEHLQRLAYYDALTQLPNRMLFMDRLDQAIADAQRNKQHVGLLFLDLDGFKKVNDTHGHHIGDRLLQEVAQRIKGLLRETDTVSRLGGDEFTVILPRLQQENDVPLVAEKIIAVLHEPFLLDGHVCHIGTSIGISLFPSDTQTAALLIKKADAAMYCAKQSGKGRYHFAHPEHVV